MSRSDGFRRLRVLALESRRRDEMHRLIAAHGGIPTVVRSVEERPCGLTDTLRTFANRLQRGEFAAVIFLTGVGARMLASAVQDVLPQPAFASALKQTIVIARGPKPLAALRQLGIGTARPIARPYTWRGILQRLDEDGIAIRERPVAVQEYGAPADELLDGLRERGAIVARVPVYEWALPSDVQPLRDAVTAAVRGDFDVLLVTSSVQVTHLWQVAEDLKVADALRRACSTMCVASIGPTTTGALGRRGVTPDREATRPNMAVLVTEAAAIAHDVLARRRR